MASENQFYHELISPFNLKVATFLQFLFYKKIAKKLVYSDFIENHNVTIMKISNVRQ
ncbi:hypothetical protein HMPREF9964_0910 [Streptococcus dysgalactiae subsp. equisimilis SK1249]|nr:hypothetical protein HMPREF9964_0910 [Streptococcus dysgalactiae subsp. equisimilis SK1249]